MKLSSRAGFTLPELLIAISIFSVVVAVVGGMYINLFRTLRRAEEHNRVYEDARFVMNKIAEEIRGGMIDYDEYYNQNVVIPLNGRVNGGPNFGADNYGQNYGRYYSSFFNTGSDNALGFDCNDGGARNRRDCTPLRRTIDRQTGSNPYTGKYAGANGNGQQEDAFCGHVGYVANSSTPAVANIGVCQSFGQRLPDASARAQNELYLISADGRKKTILARELIGGQAFGATIQNPVYALSLLRLNGFDVNGDGVADQFVCAPEFQCVGADEAPIPARAFLTRFGDCGRNNLRGDLPRTRAEELESLDACDAAAQHTKDFVPISPLRVTISELKFLITPSENPYYAFSELTGRDHPRVTVILTVQPNSQVPGLAAEGFAPVTLVETISPRILTRIPAPVLSN